MPQQAPQQQNKFSSILKNLFFLFLILQFAPAMLVNLKKQFTDMLTPKTMVGVLKIKGYLEDSSYYVRKIDKFLETKEIKGLILYIDSPGGYAGTPQVIINELKKFKEKKPIISVVENVCASGAYYVAAISNRIITTPSALVGSIGVYLRLPNIKALAENYNIKVNFIKSGKYKTIGSPFKDLLPEEAQFLQGTTDDTYRQFTSDIAEYRNLSLTNKEEWADGKIFTGAQALTLKLVDQIGSISDAKEGIRSLIAEYGMEVEKEIKLIYPKRPTTIQRLISGEDEDATEIAETLANICSKALTRVLTTKETNLEL